jgi:hypothetical protein
MKKLFIVEAAITSSRQGIDETRLVSSRILARKKDEANALFFLHCRKTPEVVSTEIIRTRKLRLEA